MGSSATRALRKLEAAGVELTPLPEGLQPRMDAGASGFPLLAEAVRTGRRVSFDYRGAAEATATARRVEPWGVVWWRGRWYLAGHDIDKQAPRVFRLSRIHGSPKTTGPEGAVTVPEGLDLTALVSAYDGNAGAVLARVRVRQGKAIGLRRQAIDVTADAAGWDVLTVTAPEAERLVEQVLGFGADVQILSPPEARGLVIRRLRFLVEAGS
jgi:proteasome accessory factor B